MPIEVHVAFDDPSDIPSLQVSSLQIDVARSNHQTRRAKLRALITNQNRMLSVAANPTLLPVATGMVLSGPTAAGHPKVLTQRPSTPAVKHGRANCALQWIL